MLFLALPANADRRRPKDGTGSLSAGAGPEIGHGIDIGARFAGPRIDGKKFFGNTFTFLQISCGSAS